MAFTLRGAPLYLENRMLGSLKVSLSQNSSGLWAVSRVTLHFELTLSVLLFVFTGSV